MERTRPKRPMVGEFRNGQGCPEKAGNSGPPAGNGLPAGWLVSYVLGAFASGWIEMTW